MQTTWLRFNLVGVIGFGVQAAILWALVSWLHIPAGAAVALAVFATVSHNFAWHERFTWPGARRGQRLGRWVQFNITTGMLSIVSNVALTGLIMSATGLPIVLANLAAVAIVSIATFLISDRVIFKAQQL